jgi:hypothetical protein
MNPLIEMILTLMRYNQLGNIPTGTYCNTRELESAEVQPIISICLLFYLRLLRMKDTGITSMKQLSTCSTSTLSNMMYSK